MSRAKCLKLLTKVPLGPLTVTVLRIIHHIRSEPCFLIRIRSYFTTLSKVFPSLFLSYHRQHDLSPLVKPLPFWLTPYWPISTWCYSNFILTMLSIAINRINPNFSPGFHCGSQALWHLHQLEWVELLHIDQRLQSETPITILSHKEVNLLLPSGLRSDIFCLLWDPLNISASTLTIKNLNSQ